MNSKLLSVRQFLLRLWYTARGRIATCGSRVQHCWRKFAVCPPHSQDVAYQSATAWLKKLNPKADAQGYDKALTYAWRRFDQVNSASETLDKKADNIMRNAGLVAGLLGLAINTIKISYPQLLIPSLVAFTASLIIAALACNPTGGATSASVADVIDDVADGHTSDAWMAASVHCAIVGRNALNNWKADRIRWATYAFCIGLALFLVPVSVMWTWYGPAGQP